MGNVAQPHETTRHQSHRLDPGEQGSVSIQDFGRLVSGLPEIGGEGHHHRHGRVYTGDFDAFHQVACLSGRQHLAGDGPFGVDEVDQHRGRAARDPVDPGVTVVAHLARRRLDDDPGKDVRIDAQHAHARLGDGDLDQSGLDRKGPDGREDVAAAHARVDRLFGQVALGEKVIDVGVLAACRMNDRDLAALGIVPDTKPLIELRQSQDVEQQPIAHRRLLRQIGLHEKERR